MAGNTDLQVINQPSSPCATVSQNNPGNGPDDGKEGEKQGMAKNVVQPGVSEKASVRGGINGQQNTKASILSYYTINTKDIFYQDVTFARRDFRIKQNIKKERKPGFKSDLFKKV